MYVSSFWLLAELQWYKYKYIYIFEQSRGLKKKKKANIRNLCLTSTVWHKLFLSSCHMCTYRWKVCVCFIFIHIVTQTVHTVKELFKQTNAPWHALCVSRAGLEQMTNIVLLSQKTSWTSRNSTNWIPSKLPLLTSSAVFLTFQINKTTIFCVFYVYN